jgi:hypothetical protein
MMQFCRISTKDAPLLAWARLNMSGRCLSSVSPERATKRAPAPSANVHGWSGASTEPSGLEGVRVPTGEVGEYWPLVRP